MQSNSTPHSGFARETAGGPLPSASGRATRTTSRLELRFGCAARCGRTGRGRIQLMRSFSRTRWFANGRNPSPGPRRLAKTPVAVHPLPLGEGLEFLHFFPWKDPIPFLAHGGGVRQSREHEESRCSADLRFAGPRFAKSPRPQNGALASPFGWEGQRSQTCFSPLLKHPSFCLLLFAFRLLPSAYCFLPTAYSTRPIHSGRESR